MTLFDFFERNQRPTAKPARHARKSPRRILGAHFEWLEPRCLMSVAPSAPSLVERDNAQYTSFYVAPLVPRTDSQNSTAPQPNFQLQLQPAEGAANGIVILGGMTDIAPLTASGGSLGVPSADFSGIFNHYESGAVQEMLRSLKYVPTPPGEQVHEQPTLVPPDLTSAPPLPTIAPPLASKSPSLSGSAPLLPSSAPALPILTPSLRSEPSTPSNNAPTLASPDSLGRQGAQNNTEGGMVSLVRQPVAQASTVDNISVAAINALLELPAKVDGMQGRFQAFEISVTTERPLPVAPLPAGAKIHLPIESTNAITPPATDFNLHGAWDPPDSAGAIPPFNLSSEEFTSAALSTAASPLPESALPFAGLPHAAIDAVFGELSSESTDNSFSSPRLDVATATLLAVVIGRALWPTRAPKSGSPEKTATSRDAE